MRAPEDAGQRELRWLRRVRDCARLLAAETDPKRLLPHILDAAIEITDAERGFLVQLTGRRAGGGPTYRVQTARGFDREAIRSPQGEVSRRVVQRVVESGRGLVTASEDGREVLDISSVKARRVLSILCVPLSLRGEVRGALYLDHRLERGAFLPEDLGVLATFADQAALALEAAEQRARGPRLAVPPPGPDRAEEAPSPPGRSRLGALVGGSPGMQRLYAAIERAASAGGPVLIVGESGSGKRLAARELHGLGPDAARPLVVLACRGLGDDPPASEAPAGPGTLVLDEVGDLSLGGQAWLLRLLAGQGARRVVVTTQYELPTLVEAGRFRGDLCQRLQGWGRLDVPPLRARREDVLPLLEHFLGAAALELSPRACELLCSYSWPGNVGELRAEALRLAVLGRRRISARQLSPGVRAGQGLGGDGGPFSGKTMAQVQREMIAAALRACGGNKTRAALQLDIPRSTLGDLIRQHRLE